MMLVIWMLAITQAGSGLEQQGQSHKAGHMGTGVSVTQDIE